MVFLALMLLASVVAPFWFINGMILGQPELTAVFGSFVGGAVALAVGCAVVWLAYLSGVAGIYLFANMIWIFWFTSATWLMDTVPLLFLFDFGALGIGGAIVNVLYLLVVGIVLVRIVLVKLNFVSL